MTEKQVKRFYDSASRAIVKHCKKNNIDIKKINCEIAEDSRTITHFLNDKELMISRLINEPQIKIKKIKP